MGTIRRHGNLFTQQHRPCRNGDHPSESMMWLPMWRGHSNMATHPVLSPYTYALSKCNSMTSLADHQCVHMGEVTTEQQYESDVTQMMSAVTYVKYQRKQTRQCKTYTKSPVIFKKSVLHPNKIKIIMSIGSYEKVKHSQ